MTGGAIIVDWLGRGGIAQTAWSWLDALGTAGHRAAIVTRAVRELAAGPGDIRGVPSPRRGGALAWHAAVVSFARRTVLEVKPSVVVLQNTVVPLLELPVVRAARTVGAQVIVVAHNAVPHERASGSTIGWRRLLRSADTVVAHSGYVAARLPVVADLVPLPRPDLVLQSLAGSDMEGSSESLHAADGLQLLQFGVLDRAYKGTDLLAALASMPDFGWKFRYAGSGAPSRSGPRLTARGGFLDASELCGEIRRSDAVALPYQRASQSAAVVLAKALLRPPVATAVGGIAEQVEDGVDGLLMPPGATADDWRDRLVSLAPDALEKMGRRGVERVDAEHAEFERQVWRICDVVPPDVR